MRVLHLTTSAVGGAAIAAQRLHAAMRAEGIESQLLSRGPLVGLDGEHAIDLSALDRLRSRATTLACNSAARDPHVFFSPWSAGFVSRETIESFAPDALIVHNWFNLLGARGDGLLTNIGVPTIFTLHDERLFTGGCHHAGACREFIRECSGCPQAHTLARHAVRVGHTALSRQLREGRVSIVGPSKWIVDEARASSALAGLPIHRIPNTINTDVFTPERRAAARARLGISDDITVLAWQPGKGDELLGDVASQVRAAAPNAKLLLLQTPGIEQHSIPTMAVGKLSTEDERADFWAAADIAFSLTEFDNFPNVTLEALACGVPFVAPRVGGAAEAVDETGGGVAAARSADAISTAIVALQQDARMRENCVQLGGAAVMALYSGSSVVRQYVEVLGA